MFINNKINLNKMKFPTTQTFMNVNAEDTLF